LLLVVAALCWMLGCVIWPWLLQLLFVAVPPWLLGDGYICWLSLLLVAVSSCMLRYVFTWL
jgi:hypothetical protein